MIRERVNVRAGELVTVQIMANGKWVQDGKNKDISIEKAVARIAKLSTQGRMGRVLLGEDVAATNLHFIVKDFREKLWKEFYGE